MQVELRIRGVAGRLAPSIFDGYVVRTDDTETVVSGHAPDEADALALIDRARSCGLTVVSWRLMDTPIEDQEDPSAAPTK